MHVFHYGDDGVADHGWGCVYRNIQSAVNAKGFEYPSMDTMLTHFGLQGHSGRDLWIEPIDACSFINTIYGLPTKHIYLKKGLSNFTRTKERPETTIYENSTLTRMIYDHFSSCENPSIIIDNGTFSYILFPDTSETVLVGDPHKVSDRELRRECPDKIFNGASSWTFCFV